MEKHFISTTNLTILFLSLSFLELLNFNSNAQLKQVKARPKLPDKVEIRNGPKSPDDHNQILLPRLFPYSLELNQADLATYDNATNNWVQFVDSFDHHELQFTYTFHNKIVAKPGKIIGNIDGTPLMVPQSFTNVVTAIPANENFQSKFLANPLPPGVHSLKLYYITQGFGLNVHSHRFEPFDSIAASAEFTYIVNMTMVDRDGDGIDDALEHHLLEMFRPYYLFSSDNEDYRPIDARTYIRSSELQWPDTFGPDIVITNQVLSVNPEAILTAKSNNNPKIASNILSTKSKSRYQLHPNDAGKAGSSWDDELSRKNIGLYGHVVPVRIQDIQSDDFMNVVQSSSTVGQPYYKVEYWQLFGYNSAGVLADHEGDWCTVQAIVDTALNLRMVLFFHHGDWTVVGMTPGYSSPTITNQYGRFEVINSGEYSPMFYLDEASHKHPCVYIEVGSHEFWPDPAGYVSLAGNHNGGGYQFLTATPPNLGEVESPLAETADAKLVLQYNGDWGACCPANGPPPGPTLHKEWSWPASSAIGWLLKDQPH